MLQVKRDKINIYLDTNIIYGFFKLNSQKLKKGEELKETRLIKSLRDGLKYFNYFVSKAVEIEIKRRLVSEFNLRRNEANYLWNILVTNLKIAEVEDHTVDWNFILTIVESVKIKKRISNLIHLSIARDNQLLFLTGDLEILSKCKKFYKDIISYKDFVKLLYTLKRKNKVWEK